jgi:plasmid stabilization system protein ParE
VSHRLVFLPEAEEDIDEAAEWYRQRNPHVAPEFTRKVRAALSRITRNPFRFPILEAEVRHLVLNQFPYSIIYLIDGDAVVILSCFHQRRDPAEWKRRL